jgi:Protein of unknown function (DUF2845)
MSPLCSQSFAAPALYRWLIVERQRDSVLRMRTLLLLALLGLAPSLALAIRCGSQIIDKGTSSAEVVAFCGNPTQVNNPTGVPDSGDAHQIEIWTYNFGPNMLMERIEFRDGIVVDIQSLGYGFNEP